MSKNVSAHMRIYIYINIVGSHGQAGRTDQYFILASCLNDEANARERELKLIWSQAQEQKRIRTHAYIYLYKYIVGSHGQAGRTDQDFILASCS